MIRGRSNLFFFMKTFMTWSWLCSEKDNEFLKTGTYFFGRGTFPVTDKSFPGGGTRFWVRSLDIDNFIVTIFTVRVCRTFLATTRLARDYSGLSWVISDTEKNSSCKISLSCKFFVVQEIKWRSILRGKHWHKLRNTGETAMTDLVPRLRVLWHS